MTVPAEEASANYVPAAAVRRRMQALSGFIGRKAYVGGQVSRVVKDRSSTAEAPSILLGWRMSEEVGIPSVAVKCVDIGRNTSCESGLLGHT